jgi:CRISPR/Cas system endoribonuclease Cas6 (RAMP superfamily)
MILSKLTATEAENNKKMIGSKKIKLFTHDIFQMNKKDDKSRAFLVSKHNFYFT